MRILIVEDSVGWAIGALTNVIVRNNPQLNIRVLTIHPKELRNLPEPNIAKFEYEVQTFNPDVIHFQYWDLANTLGKLDVCRNRKLILTHHNQKNLLTHDWSFLDCIVCHTQKAKKTLEQANYWNVEVIQHGIDVEKFRFNEDYNVENKMLGYVGRVVPWKGLYEILKVAKELNTKVIIQGKPDRPEYWNKCIEFLSEMDLRFNTPDEDQHGVYCEMGAYIGNSCDNIEEGTLGLLEAMSCGVPVITTPSGEAKDIIVGRRKWHIS
jgi:glycosyltransferase involved in cell wall biosynthesis